MAKEFVPLGSIALSGYFQQGLAELRAAAPYGDSPIAQNTNYAMPGVATPGEIAEERRDDQESSLEGRMRQIDDRDDKGRDDKGRDMDRE